MEETKQPTKVISLVQKSGTYNYKLIIPAEVERKIRFTCQKVWNTEWSGTLFFTHEGSFENDDLVIRCVDIYIMDIGTQAYTEFDMNPDVIWAQSLAQCKATLSFVPLCPESLVFPIS